MTTLATSNEHMGRRYRAHLFTSLTSAGFYTITCVNGKEARHVTGWHTNKPTITNSILDSALTAKEYNSLNGDYAGLQAKVRRPFWEHMFFSKPVRLIPLQHCFTSSVELQILHVQHHKKKWHFHEFEQ